jgi:predicted house-cleaning NTP pyrophosphatase (Maf/HAM1 superfamily)
MAESASQQRLYLAGASPRRVQLLREAGYGFERCPAPLNEAAEDVTGLSPERAAAVLAERRRHL